MPAAYTTLTLTDGTTSAVLTDGTNYQLVDGGWAPNVAALRRSPLGGRGPYEDVEESITINVLGATGAACLENLARLSVLLDQAERWRRGEPVAAVKLLCQPQGSQLSGPLTAVVLGRAGSGVTAPETFNDLLMCYEIPGVTVQLVRRGQWLGAEDGVSGATVEMPEMTGVTFGSVAAIPSPMALDLVFTSAFSAVEGYVLAASSADRLVVVEGEAALSKTSGGWGVLTDPTNKARGGSVLRYTAAPVGTDPQNSWSVGSLLGASVRRVGVFAALRNNSSATWTVRAYARPPYSATRNYGPNRAIDASTTNPRILFLGALASAGPIAAVGMELTPSTTTGSPSLDIDYLILLALDDLTSGAVAIKTGSDAISRLLIDPRALDGPAPVAQGTRTFGDPYFLTYQGDPWLSSTGAVAVACAALTQGTKWRATDGAGNPLQMFLTAFRRTAYLTPQ